jgi:hypothetical protein
MRLHYRHLHTLSDLAQPIGFPSTNNTSWHAANRLFSFPTTQIETVNPELLLARHLPYE